MSGPSREHGWWPTNVWSPPRFIGCSRGEWSGGEAYAPVGGIKYGIEPLKESATVYEVEVISESKCRCQLDNCYLDCRQ